MALSISPRHLRASRIVRVMALFAWIWLALSPLAAAMSPADAMDMSGPGMQGTSMHAGQHDGCCGSVPLHASCQCVSMCGAALLPTVTVLPGAILLAPAYATLRGIDAPSLDAHPPLRPPTA